MLTDTLSLSSNQQVIGDWQLVWGPQFWQAPDSVLSGNVMYVAHTAAMPGAGDAYVVAPSATNSRSLYDWFGDDFDVAASVDFASFDPSASSAPFALKKPVDPQGVTISMGTATRVWHLLNMLSPQTALVPNTTLAEFLHALGNTGATVIFTGHSLAGALSPTRATWLTERVRPGLLLPHCGGDAGQCRLHSAVSNDLAIAGCGRTGRPDLECRLVEYARLRAARLGNSDVESDQDAGRQRQNSRD